MRQFYKIDSLTEMGAKWTPDKILSYYGKGLVELTQMNMYLKGINVILDHPKAFFLHPTCNIGDVVNHHNLNPTLQRATASELIASLNIDYLKSYLDKYEYAFIFTTIDSSNIKISGVVCEYFFVPMQRVDVLHRYLTIDEMLKTL